MLEPAARRKFTLKRAYGVLVVLTVSAVAIVVRPSSNSLSSAHKLIESQMYWGDEDNIASWYGWRAPGHVLKSALADDGSYYLYDEQYDRPVGASIKIAKVGQPGTKCVEFLSVSPDGTRFLFPNYSELRAANTGVVSYKGVGIDVINYTTHSTIKYADVSVDPAISLTWCGDSRHWVRASPGKGNVKFECHESESGRISQVATINNPEGFEYLWLQPCYREQAFYAIYGDKHSHYRLIAYDASNLFKRLREYDVEPPTHDKFDYPNVSPNETVILWVGHVDRSWPRCILQRSANIVYATDMHGGHAVELARVEINPSVQLFAFDQDQFDVRWLPGGEDVSVMYKGGMYVLPVKPPNPSLITP